MKSASNQIETYLPCMCDQAGQCPRFQRLMNGRAYQICRNEYLAGHAVSPNDRRSYIDTWLGQAGKPQPDPASVIEQHPRTSLPCTFRGQPTGEVQQCSPCAGNVRLKVFACNHPSHAAKPTTTDRECRICADYEAPELPNKTDLDHTFTPLLPHLDHTKEVARAGPPAEPRCSHARQTMAVEDMATLIDARVPSDSDPWPPGWAGWEVTTRAHQWLLERRIKELPEYPGGYEGRGIVIAAGGPKYFTCAWVAVNVLRSLGCRLPIQFWYLGPREIDPYMRALVKPLGVECVDAREVEKRHPWRILAGWELKPFAVMHAPFQEVMYLDADNVPARDPTFLFDAPEYREHGAAFWPDLPPHDRPSGEWLPKVVWDNFQIEYRREVDFESGQFIIDKARCWGPLQVTRWLNEHSDWTYLQIFGDKSTFHLGWRKLDRDYAMPRRAAGWVQHDRAGAILQHDFHGMLAFQHRCQPYPDKWSLHGPNARIPGFVNEQVCFDALSELRRRWNGVPWSNPHPNAAERAAIFALEGQRFLYRRLGYDQRHIRLEPGGTIGEGAAGCERRWAIHDNAGRLTLSISGDEGLTALLDSWGALWTGRWVVHEKMEVSLESAEVPSAEIAAFAGMGI